MREKTTTSKQEVPTSKQEEVEGCRERRELVRGEPVVSRVLAATLGELARAGYKALRMENVALSAGVNKTTVYRRWPDKAGLVREALTSLSRAAAAAAPPATGSLRGDLLEVGRRMVGLMGTPEGQSLARMLVAEGSDPEVADLKRAMRARHQSVPLAVLAAAAERGELPAGCAHRDLLEAFAGAITHKLFFMNEAIDDAFLERLVDMLLYGVLPRRGG